MHKIKYIHDKWVLVTTLWRALRLRMEERPQYGGQLRIYWIGSCQQPTRYSPPALLRNMHKCLGPGLMLWYDLSNGKGTWDLVHGMCGACI